MPLPTVEQTESFAEYVVDARSWHKHLPCTPPGAPFVFFLDPNAGRELVQAEAGHRTYTDRIDGQQRFHYTWMPTAEYHARFGHWQYATDHGTRLVFMPSDGRNAQLHGFGSVEIMAPDGEWIPVPPDVLAAGTMTMTAHVHPTFSAEWLAYYSMMMARCRAHPEEADERIELYERHEGDLPSLDQEIEEARTRLRAELRATLLRGRARLAGERRSTIDVYRQASIGELVPHEQ
ncbi:hypothetical protein [Paraliomyxa miuraensis]|uniref:hypothetical protein n=1 Tax=Paraliomyxa miuraensis TaxID=376150 RepID=UPI0022529626|nr:hypothetical protein [Paraliomyxa miuraensis]MCX4239109.1 hypothetical protein [Paraliomyxa miuraensis]